MGLQKSCEYTGTDFIAGEPSVTITGGFEKSDEKSGDPL